MKNRRVVCRLWGHRQRGGVVYRNEDLTGALKRGELAEVGKIAVGARQLRQLVDLMPGDHCLVKCNGSLEVESLNAIWRKNGESRKCHFEKPRRGPTASFRVFTGAWKPKVVNTTVVVKTQKF